MTIQLTPEDEKLIQKRLQPGTFRSIEEVMHDALEAQDSEAEWLADQRESIDEKLPGELFSLTVARVLLGRLRASGCGSANPCGRGNQRADGHLYSVA